MIKRFILTSLIAIFLVKLSHGYMELNLIEAKTLDNKPNPYVDIHYNRIRKFNKTHHAIVANLTLKKEADNSYKVECYAFKKSVSVYKRMPYRMSGGFCDMINNDVYFMAEARKKSNFPPAGTCPWPKGNYWIHNYIPDISKLPPIMESGDYMIECRFYDKNGTYINGSRTYSQIIHIAGGFFN